MGPHQHSANNGTMANNSALFENKGNRKDGLELTVKDLVRSSHARSKSRPIVMADEFGCFGSALLPIVLPVVVDANFLRDELLADVRRSTRTVLANASNTGVLRMFCAQHVVDEVNNDLTEWALSAGLDPVATQRVWEATYQPLLRCVDPVLPAASSSQVRRSDSPRSQLPVTRGATP